MAPSLNRLSLSSNDRDERVADSAFSHVVGESPAMRQAIELAQQVAQSPFTTVLLEGETGTGKELFARGIHGASAAGEPFVAISCAAIPENLLESELFGHERGAFTGARLRKLGLVEHAAAGTLFLDEVHQLSMDLQAKLLRLLENRTFRRLGGAEEQRVACRVIAGTNAALELAIASNRFRSDLYYRLNVFRIELPPLRQRREDIVPLAEHFLREIALRAGTKVKSLAGRTKELLTKHDWRGNAREIRNVVERASILAGGRMIQPSHIQIQRRELVAQNDFESVVGTIVVPSQGKSLREAERELIRLTMILTEGNLSAAARLLRISRPTLARKMRQGGITRRSLLASN